MRLSAEDTIQELQLELSRAHARAAELVAQLAGEESARADLSCFSIWKTCSWLISNLLAFGSLPRLQDYSR